MAEPGLHRQRRDEREPVEPGETGVAAQEPGPPPVARARGHEGPQYKCEEQRLRVRQRQEVCGGEERHVEEAALGLGLVPAVVPDQHLNEQPGEHGGDGGDEHAGHEVAERDVLDQPHQNRVARQEDDLQPHVGLALGRRRSGVPVARDVLEMGVVPAVEVLLEGVEDGVRAVVDDVADQVGGEKYGYAHAKRHRRGDQEEALVLLADGDPGDDGAPGRRKP